MTFQHLKKFLYNRPCTFICAVILKLIKKYWKNEPVLAVLYSFEYHLEVAISQGFVMILETGCEITKIKSCMKKELFIIKILLTISKCAFKEMKQLLLLIIMVRNGQRTSWNLNFIYFYYLEIAEIKRFRIAEIWHSFET